MSRPSITPIPVVSAAAVLALALLPSFASAEMPATIRGVVYSCDTGAPIANASVGITRVGERMPIPLLTNAQGAFARVGIPPGQYVVSVAGRIRGSRTIAVRGASRLARVDTDDVMDMRIGTQTIVVPPEPPPAALMNLSNPHLPTFVLEPVPICDAAVVPPAPSTSDRYVIH